MEMEDFVREIAPEICEKKFFDHSKAEELLVVLEPEEIGNEDGRFQALKGRPSEAASCRGQIHVFSSILGLKFKI